MEKSISFVGTSNHQVDTYDIARERFCKLETDFPGRIRAAFLHSHKPILIYTFFFSDSLALLVWPKACILEYCMFKNQMKWNHHIG